jgi:hypothetical protein
MRILLVNEASGVHHYLRQGLEELGHEVLIALPGVGNYQARKADLHFGVSGQTFRARMRRLLEPTLRLRQLGRFDLANYQLGISLFGSPANRYADLRMLKSSGAQLSYYGLGCDEVSLLRIRPDVGTLPCCEQCIAHDPIGHSCAKQLLARRPRASKSAGLFDFAVSAAYVYDHGLDFFPNATQARIQFPIDARDLAFSPARGALRPIIVHSPTRAGFKGTRNILESMRQLAERRDDFEFRVVQGLSHAEYLQTMQDCDIYIDQVLSADSFGIAALENMACGKVVVSGNGPVSWGAFPFMREAPVVPAAAEPSILAGILSDLLDRKHEFPAIAEQGRRYVLNHHNHVAIAARFVALWSGDVRPAAVRIDDGIDIAASGSKESMATNAVPLTDLPRV